MVEILKAHPDISFEEATVASLSLSLSLRVVVVVFDLLQLGEQELTEMR